MAPKYNRMASATAYAAANRMRAQEEASGSSTDAARAKVRRVPVQIHTHTGDSYTVYLTKTATMGQMVHVLQAQAGLPLTPRDIGTGYLRLCHTECMPEELRKPHHFHLDDMYKRIMQSKMVEGQRRAKFPLRFLLLFAADPSKRPNRIPELHQRFVKYTDQGLEEARSTMAQAGSEAGSDTSDDQKDDGADTNQRPRLVEVACYHLVSTLADASSDDDAPEPQQSWRQAPEVVDF